MYLSMKHKYFQKHTKPTSYFLTFAVVEMLKWKP